MLPKRHFTKIKNGPKFKSGICRTVLNQPGPWSYKSQVELGKTGPGPNKIKISDRTGPWLQKIENSRAMRWPEKGSMDRQFCLSWSGSKFQIFDSPGPVRDFNFCRSNLVQDLRKLMISVRVGPIYSWSKPVRDFFNFLGPGSSWSLITKFFLVLVRS